MNRHLGALLGLALLSAIAACGTNDGRAPKITSFSASPDSLPLGGGPVTFTWETRRAETLSIEPSIGAVTGTSLTFQVTSGGTYTLVAQNNHGITTAETTLTVGAPITVVGTAYTEPQGALQDMTIVILGQPWVLPAISGSSGEFVLDGVVPPYDIALVSPTSPQAVIYRNVTRTDPFLALPAYFGVGIPPQVTRSGSIDGTITGGAPLPLAAGGFLLGTLETERQSALVLPGNATNGNWSTFFTWNNVDPVNVTAHLLQANGPAPLVTYTGYGKVAATVANLENSSGHTLALSPVTTASASGTYVPPLFAPPVIPQTALFRFRAPRVFQDYLSMSDTVTLPMVQSTNQTFSIALPEVPGAYFHLFQNYGSPYGSVNHYARVTPGEERVIELPEAVRMTVPANSASIDVNTRFAVIAPAGVIVEHLVFLGPAQIAILTADPSFTLAELHLEDLGMLPGMTTGGSWSTFSFGFYDSMDDALDFNGSDGNLMIGFPGPSRSLLFQP